MKNNRQKHTDWYLKKSQHDVCTLFFKTDMFDLVPGCGNP